MLNQALICHENGTAANRLFYLALPPSVFENVTVLIKNACMGEK
jgi:glucose-6-phosphate 1-dehydrogenase